MQLRRHKLDFPGGQFWIGFLALEDLAFHCDDELAARLLGFGVRRGLRLFVEDHLDDAGAVAHIEKEQTTEVAAARHPTHHNCVAPFVFGAQFAAVVCALQITQKIQQVLLSSRSTDLACTAVGQAFLPVVLVLNLLYWGTDRNVCPTLRMTVLFAFANVPANPARCTLPASRPPASSVSTGLRILRCRRESARTSRRACPPGRGPCRIFARRAAAQR